MSTTTVGAADFAFVQELVLRRSAIVLDAGKEYLVDARLTPVARQQGLTSVAALVASLRGGAPPALATAVVEALTTNETSWMRDRHPFDALRDIVVPDLLVRRSRERRIDVWSAACSTGQEPYSIAMLLLDALALHSGWSTSILATDLSSGVVAQARSGVYSQLEVNRGLPASLLVRHFERTGLTWQLKEPLRRAVTFREHNLISPMTPTPTPVDVIFLRNVLIYFDASTKRKVLGLIRASLRPDGYLFLGAAETTHHLDDAFERVQLGSATAYRLTSRKAAP